MDRLVVDATTDRLGLDVRWEKLEARTFSVPATFLFQEGVNVVPLGGFVHRQGPGLDAVPYRLMVAPRALGEDLQFFEFNFTCTAFAGIQSEVVYKFSGFHPSHSPNKFSDSPFNARRVPELN